MKSWKTTVLGIGMLLSVIGIVVVSVLDNDPETNPNWSVLSEQITQGLTMLGISFGGLLGLAARDNSKSNSD